MNIKEHVSLNLNIRGMEQSPTIAINEKSKKLRETGKSIYRLGLGQSPFPVPVPVVEALKTNAHQKDYLPAEGLPSLRKAVSKFHHQGRHISVARFYPEGTIISSGLSKWCGAGVKVHAPEGAFYLFPDFSPFADSLARRGITLSMALCDRLLQDTGVAALPGKAFERPSGELTVRLAYVDFDGAKALTASETTPLDQTLPENFDELWCGNVIKAMNLIVQWINT